MKPALIRKLVNAILLLAPLVGAIVAAAVVRASEPLPTVTISTLDADATEAGHAAIFMAIREAGSIAQPLVVPIKLGGSATPSADYMSPGTSITFPAQTPKVLVKITPVADALIEGTETVTVTLMPTPNAYTLGEEKSATAKITDASGSAASTAGSGAKGGPTDPPRRDNTHRPALPTPTGMLTVEITLDGQGSWKSRLGTTHTRFQVLPTLTGEGFTKERYLRSGTHAASADR
jgi:hypothetical protein